MTTKNKERFMGDPSRFSGQEWRKELKLLLLRHASQGAHYDTLGMTEAELWGLYLYLKRLES